MIQVFRTLMSNDGANTADRSGFLAVCGVEQTSPFKALSFLIRY